MEAAGHSLLVEAHPFEAVRFLRWVSLVMAVWTVRRKVSDLFAASASRGASVRQREEIHFGGAKAVETPCVPGDGVGEFYFVDFSAPVRRRIRL